MTIFKRPIYRMFIDEMGNHHYPKDEQDELNKFLCLTGIIFKLGEDYNVSARAKLSLEDKFWPLRNPDYPVILHRDEIIRKKGYFSILQDPEKERAFNEELLKIFGSMNSIIITVVLDKFSHRKSYKSIAYEPYSWCLNILMQRFIKFLKRINSTGDVMIETRGKKEDQTTKNAFTNIYLNGCHYHSSTTYQQYLTSKEIKIQLKKDNVFGLQVADIVGSAIQRKILFNKNFKQIYTGTYNEQLYETVQKQIFQNKGDVLNWGETFLP